MDVSILFQSLQRKFWSNQLR